MIVAVAEPSQVGQARRLAGEQAEIAGLNDEKAGRVALVATELATNLIKHAGQGYLIAEPLRRCGWRRRRAALARQGSRHRGSEPGAVGRLFDRWEPRRRARSGGAPGGSFRDFQPSRAGHRCPGAVPPPRLRRIANGSALARSSNPIRASGSAATAGPMPAAPSGRRRLGAWRAGGARRRGRDRYVPRRSRPGLRRIGRGDPPRPGADARRRCGRGAGRSERAGRALCRYRQHRRRAWLPRDSSATWCRTTARPVTSRRASGSSSIRFTGEPTLILHSDGMSARWDLESYPGSARGTPGADRRVLFREYRRGARRLLGRRVACAAMRTATVADRARCATPTSSWRAAAPAGSRNCSATICTPRPASRPRCRKSPATRSSTAAAAQIEFCVDRRQPRLRSKSWLPIAARAFRRRARRCRGRAIVPAGMGIGLSGAQRLMDEFCDRDRTGAGTADHDRGTAAARSGVARRLRSRALARSLASDAPADPVEEIRQQNREMLFQLEELERRQRRARTSTRSCRTPIAASWRSMPNSTSGPIICGAPTS